MKTIMSRMVLTAKQTLQKKILLDLKAQQQKLFKIKYGEKILKIQSLNESWGNFQWPSVNVIKILMERRGKILNNNG